MRKSGLILAALIPLVAFSFGCQDRPTVPVEPSFAKGADTGGPHAAAQERGRVVPDHYIVVLRDEATDPAAAASAVARAHGLERRHTYSRALRGFAAIIPPPRLDAVRADPRVRYVAADREDELHQQALPTGIDRIEADLNTSETATDPVDVDIAILDSGVDLDHPDLKVVQAVSFAGGTGDDGHGHGTHVAGR